MTKIVLKFIIILLLLLFACEQMPDEPKFIDIIEDIESTASISVTDSSDSLIVWGTRNINFDVELNDQVIDTCRIQLDDIIIANHKRKNSRQKMKTINKIKFESEKYSDGWHKLKYFTYSHLKPNEERQYYIYFTDTLEINIEIDNSVPTAYEITKIEPTNGKLQINWQKYKGIGFQEYSVYKNLKENVFHEFKLVATITNTSTTYWRDPQYIGKECSYYIKLATKNKTITSKTRTVNYPEPSLSVQNIENKRIELKWNKCVFDSAFKKYRITRGNRKTQGGYAIFNISNVNDTTYIDSTVFFGKMMSYRLAILNNNKYYEIISKVASYFLGYKIPNMSGSIGGNFYYDSKNEIILITGQVTLGLNAKTMERIYYTTNSLTFSGDHKAAYFRNGSFDYVSINPLNGDIIKKYNIQDIVGNEINYIHSFFATSNGRILFNGSLCVDSYCRYKETYYLDLEKGKILSKLSKAVRLAFKINGISSDGKYIIIGKTKYEYSEQTGFKTIGEVDFTEKVYTYPENNIIIKIVNDQVYVIDYTTKQIKNNFSVNKPLYSVSIDLNRNVIGGYFSDETYRIYDLTSGELRFSIRATKITNICLAGDKLVSTWGYYLPIEY